MLNKIAAHPTLQHDGDLKLFLESDAFNVDIRHKERKEPLVSEGKGMFSSIGIGSTVIKFVEHDDVRPNSMSMALLMLISGFMKSACTWKLWRTN
jgi:hypothetical protein